MLQAFYRLGLLGSRWCCRYRCFAVFGLLAGYVTGTDLDQAKEVASQIRAGQVAINSPQPDLNAPFGGYKMSGNGRIWGIAGLEEYLETTAIVGNIK